MDRMQSGGIYTRPYQSTCGMQDNIYGKPVPKEAFSSYQKASTLPASAKTKGFDLPNPFPLAMAYVPRQQMHKTFDYCEMLEHGTIFPELCMPFYGKRGVCRC